MFFHRYLLICLYLSSKGINCTSSEDSPSDIIVYDKRWLQFLNSISLSTPLLTQNQIDQLSKEHTKSEANQADYIRKIEELKCVYGGIVQAMFEYINEVIIKVSSPHIVSEVMDTNSIIGAVPIFKEFQTYIARMFSVLKVANENAFAWMWDVYFMLSMVIETKELGKLVSDFKIDDRLRKDITVFCDSCIKLNYLKPIKISIEQHQVVTAEKIVGHGLSDVKLAYDDNECPFYTFVYRYADGFELSKMLGTQLKNNQILIRPPLVKFLNDTVKELNVVWNAPISRLYGNNKVDLVRHHNLIATLVEISVTYDIWAYLNTYYFTESLPIKNCKSLLKPVKYDPSFTSIQKMLKKTAEMLDVHANGFYGHLQRKMYDNEMSTEWLDIVNVTKRHFIELLNSVKANKITLDDLMRIKKTIKINDYCPLDSLNLNDYMEKIKETLGPYVFSLYKFYKSSQ